MLFLSHSPKCWAYRLEPPLPAKTENLRNFLAVLKYIPKDPTLPALDSLLVLEEALFH
jgi:hypothetical protein